MILGKKIFKIVGWFSLICLIFISSCDRNGTGIDHGGMYGHLYVLNQTSQTIYVYNDSSLARVDSFAAAIPSPHWLEYAPDGKYYYVVSRFAPGHIAKFDAVTNALLDTITMNGVVFPTSLAISSDGMFGYLCDFTNSFTSGHIHKYNLNTMSFVDSSFGNGAASHDLMFTSDYSKLVACSRNTDDITIVYFPGDSVALFPLDTNNIRPNPPVYAPYGVHIDHNDSLAYITCLYGEQVRIFDLYTRSVVDSIIIPAMANPVNDPNGVATGPTLSVISHDDSKIFVTTQWGNSLVVASTSTGAILKEIKFSTPRPFGVKMNHDGSRVYVACANVQDQPGRVYVIDGINLIKLDSVNVGLNSYGLYWHQH